VTTKPPGGVGPISLGGVLASQVADLSVALTRTPPSITVGQDATFTLTLANAGPDASAGPEIRVVVSGDAALMSANASSGSFSGPAGVWTAGTVAAGTDATLALVVRATKPGQIGVVAEVLADAGHDPDSKPDNRAANEDDRASAAVDAATASQAAPKKTKPVLSLALSPKRDAKPPHRMHVRRQARDLGKEAKDRQEHTGGGRVRR